MPLRGYVKREVEAARTRRGAFGQLVHSALSGDLEPLSEYLLSDRPLSEEDRKWLAWLIERQWRRIEELGPRPRGHPVGVSRLVQAHHCAVHLVNTWKMIWRQREHRQRVPMSISRLLIPPAIKLVEERFRSQRGKITPSAVEALLTARRSPNSLEYAKELFPDAKYLIPELERL